METRFDLEASCRGHGFWEYARTMIEPRFLVFINRGLAGPWESCPNYKKNTKKTHVCHIPDSIFYCNDQQ